MPYKKLKASKPEFGPEYIQKKISLIEKGLPIDITEKELHMLEKTLRGAQSFYIDLLLILEGHREKGMDIETDYISEAKNLAGVALALRKIDEFRSKHWSH